MRILYIDLASNKGLLALVTEKSVTASDHVDQRMGDQELMPRLEKLLQVAGCRFSDLTQVACVIGPGGFMSIRVGVALANTLADQLGIPVAGVHLSDVYAERMQKGKRKKQDVVWLHSTKKTELFVRGFGDYKKQWPEATHVTLEDFLQSIKKPMQWIGELIPEHRTAIASAAEVHGSTALTTGEPPLLSLEEILPNFMQHQEFKQQILEPWYGRGW